MKKAIVIGSNLVQVISRMLWMRVLIPVFIVAVFTPNVNAAYYETNMGWTDDGSVALSPINGAGPDIYVTFSSSRGSDVSSSGLTTLIGYHHGGSNPTITMTFSSDVINVELFMRDLDNPTEDLDSMPLFPTGTTGDFYLAGNSVRSRVNNGSGSIIYDTISDSETLRFRFDDQLSNLVISDLNFETVPVPGAVWLLGSGLIGILGFRKK